jgi:HSP20 family protein
MVIRGEKAARVEEPERSWHRVERRHGSFERTLRLPETVDAGKIEATSNHGVLTLTLPKIEEVQPRRIEVQSK